MRNTTCEKESLYRLKEAIERELDNLGWQWSPLFSSLLDQIQNRIDELRQSEGAKKLEQRTAVLKAQVLCLELERCLGKLAEISE